MGSHIDTVPDAGAFDGVLGVAMALEWVRLAREIAFPVPIEVIAFSEEEGVRFGVPFIGSRAVAGRFDPSLLALKDGEGISLAEAIRRFGLDPAKIEEAAVHKEGGRRRGGRRGLRRNSYRTRAGAGDGTLQCRGRHRHRRPDAPQP